MSRFLPLFPLNIVVYPGEKLNIHIFEMRYRQLITESHTNGTTFGIPVYLNSGIGEYGTEIKLLGIEKKYPGGEMDVKTQGLGIFKIKDFQRQAPDRLYPSGEIEDLTPEQDNAEWQHLQVKEMLQELYSALSIQSLMLKLGDNFRSYDIAHHIGFTLEQEYALLQCLKESERLEIILSHLQQILPVVQQTEKLKERVKLNGHFKNLTPPNF
ncbi:LON peptidase substrate-binding domain-containing protein [Rufibacter roseus]|uniref:LON peptidase substrate-binding domain-containing protein n=1 Tax=Rufibacter roseus TaxID=1567108 RepID=A0ABW2DS30_9BACT|nr:LON peptidase substrate-binding domain-containing protein [Rufibacter roseus]